MKQEVVGKSRREKENAQNLFTYLPLEIMIDILLRLTVLTVMKCKCVCKSWRDLIKTPEFVKSHLSISVPGLAVCLMGTKQYEIVEFVDEQHHLNSVFTFDLPFISGEDDVVHSSVNGLLFVCNRYWFDNPCADLSVCNPITREYIRLPSPRSEPCENNIYGFGVSKMSGEYKVVRINRHDDGDNCQVYTVGSGSWRRIAIDDQLRHWRNLGAFLNGNLHWLAYKGSSPLICCLDLETECFSTFSRPPPPCKNSDYDYRVLSVLGDYLCVCDTSVVHGIVLSVDIWLMKEYGDEKSWKNEFMISAGYMDGDHYPIKVFKDGDMLMEWGRQQLLYYSSKSQTIGYPYIDTCFGSRRTVTTVYTPSFLPLKTFAMENVISF